MIQSVVLIDDDRPVLQSLQALFETAGHDVWPFDSPLDFLDRIEGIPPACIVTDLRMPRMDGLTLVKQLKHSVRSHWPIIVISGHADVPQAVEAMRAGALDFLVKPFPPQQLLTLVMNALRVDEGGAVLSQADERYQALTQRERQVVEMLVAGASSKTAGFALGISPRTVDVFRGKAMKKMGVSNTAALSTVVAAVSPGVRAVPRV